MFTGYDINTYASSSKSSSSQSNQKIKDAWNMGAVAVGATIYWGSAESTRQLQEVAQAFEMAHELGMCTVLWCYTRNSGFKVGDTDYHTAADFTGQANHLGVTLQADIIKQKLPTLNPLLRV